MAIYHFHCKIVSRKSGSNAVQQLAYQRCSKEYDPTTDLTFDFKKKKGHKHHNVLLPANAPAEFKDANALVVSIEETEKAANAQLMRSLDAALPNELTKEQQISLVEDFAKNVWVKEGMCVIYDMHDAHKKYKTGVQQKNDHVHFKLSLREIEENGKWKSKSKKKYLCRNKEGKEKFLDANEFKNNSEGFEKVYKYKFKNDHVKLTSSEAQEEKYKNYKRVSKYPIDKKVDTTNWNEHSSLEKWRSEWANYVNKHLELNGFDERISEKTLLEQGIERVAQVHVGPAANAIEEKEKGILYKQNQLEKYEPITERAKHNHEIKMHNEKIKMIEKDIEICKNSIEKMKNSISVSNANDHEIDYAELTDFDFNYEDCERLYNQNHEMFRKSYTNIAYDELYADVLISALDSEVYSNDITTTGLKLKENSNKDIYANNICSLCKSIEVFNIKNEIDDIDYYEKELKKLNKIKIDVTSYERDISEMIERKETLSLLNLTLRKKIDSDIEKLVYKINEREDELNDIAERMSCKEEFAFEEGMSLKEKINSLVDFIKEIIESLKEIIQEKAWILRDVQFALKDAFGFANNNIKEDNFVDRSRDDKINVIDKKIKKHREER